MERINKILVIVIIFLTIISLGLAAYAVYISFNNTGDTNIPKEVTLGDGQNKITFIVPNGATSYEQNGPEYRFVSFSWANHSNWLGIDYTLNGFNENNADEAYENFLNNPYNEETYKGFTVSINGKKIKCLDVEENNSKSNAYYIFYPLDKGNYVLIHLHGEKIKHNDIPKYVKVK